MKFKVKTDKSERNAGKVVYSTDGDENRILEESISYLKYGDHATMLPEKVDFAYPKEGEVFVQEAFRYTYDSMGNISAIYENGELFARYTYDTLNRLVREDNRVLSKTVLFAYDNCGNILSRKDLTFTLAESEKLAEDAGNMCRYKYDGDRMLSYNGEECVYDSIGNSTIYRGSTATWTDGKRLAAYRNHSFEYDGLGRRYKKDSIEYTYDFDGKLVRQSDNVNTLTYLYDHTGLAAVEHNGTKYVYAKDIQGNIVALLDTNGTPVVKYVYDAWGNHAVEVLVDSCVIGGLNPFRYRGYYYDAETGLYYLQSRYYDPEVGRFISSDDVAHIEPETSNGLNLFCYCINNPVSAVDFGGNFWETVFDVVSLVVSVVDVCKDPTDGWAWASLAADAVDLIPFVTGVGEATRAIRTTRKVADAVDNTTEIIHVAKATDLTQDAIDTIKTLDKTTGFTKSSAAAGRRIHKGYKATPEFNPSWKEYNKIKGIRPDYIDFDAKIIYELKPYNPKALKQGAKQLQKYNQKFGGGFQLWLEWY